MDKGYGAIQNRGNINSRERLLRAIRHEVPDRVPFTYQGEKETNDKLITHYHKNNIEKVLDIFKVDRLGSLSEGIGQSIWEPEKNLPDGVIVDKWGVERKWVNYSDGRYLEISKSPLADAQTLTDIENYNWPKASGVPFPSVTSRSSWEEYEKDRIIIEMGLIGTFGIAWSMRGMENLMMDMTIKPSLVRAIVDKINEYTLAVGERLYKTYPGMIDIIGCGDDFGMQTGLLISPEHFRKFFMPSLKKHYNLARKHGCICYLHSCGSVRELIPDFIEAGIEVLNPIQTACNGMDPKELKREFGKDLCFHGGIDTQKTLTHGTTDEVCSEVRERIDALGKGGGYILAPSHNIQPNTPIENILVMYKEVWNYGSYNG